MKITSFQLTIQQGLDEQGYGDNFYVNIDEKGLTNISRPYKAIPIEEQLAIEEVITSAIKAHLKLVKQVDNANRDLKLEEYRPIASVAETTSESTEVSAVPQSSRGGSDVVDSYKISSTSEETLKEEVSTRPEEEIEALSQLTEEPVKQVVITKVTEEDDW